jgi:hypothetical protein
MIISRHAIPFLHLCTGSHSCGLKHYRGIRYLMAHNSDDQPIGTPFNKTLFTYFLDTRFPVDVEID